MMINPRQYELTLQIVRPRRPLPQIVRRRAEHGGRHGETSEIPSRENERWNAVCHSGRGTDCAGCNSVDATLNGWRSVRDPGRGADQHWRVADAKDGGADQAAHSSAWAGRDGVVWQMMIELPE